VVSTNPQPVLSHKLPTTAQHLYLTYLGAYGHYWFFIYASNIPSHSLLHHSQLRVQSLHAISVPTVSSQPDPISQLPSFSVGDGIPFHDECFLVKELGDLGFVLLGSTPWLRALFLGFARLPLRPNLAKSHTSMIEISQATSFSPVLPRASTFATLWPSSYPSYPLLYQTRSNTIDTIRPLFSHSAYLIATTFTTCHSSQARPLALSYHISSLFWRRNSF
jgi:hypothetical protein